MRAFTVCLVVVAIACSGDDDDVPGDAGNSDAMMSSCSSDSQCDDGTFCNGEEVCDPTSDDADSAGCIPGEVPCEDDGTCDEANQRCVGDCPDGDGDGHADIECGGDDCDDSDPDAYPGNPEICDEEGHDEDCDPSTFGPDGDSDGFAGDDCCNAQPGGGIECGRDCNDAQSGINPGATDGCGGGDQDCDNSIDEEPDSTWYRDEDSDDFGIPDDTVMACSQPPGYAPQAGDCVDNPFEDAQASEKNPSAVDVCDEIDNDCDGAVDEAFSCDCNTPGMTRGCGIDPALNNIGICRLGSQMCQMNGTWSDCVGAVAPQMETCDSDDDDCDGTPDNGSFTTCWQDPDRDGFATLEAATMEACSCPDTWTDRDPTTDGVDCKENDADFYPGAPELCDRMDNDCSHGGGMWAPEDGDNDGHTATTYTGCDGGFPKDDCIDYDDRVFPGQTSYFDTGYCPSTHCLCEGRCEPRPNPLFACFFGCTASGASISTVFDFNCDGTTERQPSRTCQGLCQTGLACQSRGPKYTGSPACGSTVNYVRCGTGASPSCPCFESASGSDALACR